MLKPFNLFEIIQDRVNKESWIKWANESENPVLPVFEKPKKVKKSAGLYNFILQLRP